MWLDVIMEEFEGFDAPPELPTFIIIEDKRATTLEGPSSTAALFGQLKSQLIRRYVPSSPMLPTERKLTGPSLLIHLLIYQRDG
jgi:hypothetical protein